MLRDEYVMGLWARAIHRNSALLMTLAFLAISRLLTPSLTGSAGKAMVMVDVRSDAQADKHYMDFWRHADAHAIAKLTVTGGNT
jgi:hypothetical protein